jgi:rhamnose ABC transporter rhamnose-binding protein
MKHHFAALVLTILCALTACAKPKPQSQKPTIGVMPKLVGIDYFNACEKGALEAGRELGLTVVYDGPITNDVTKQAEMIDTWITRQMDVITVAPNDPHALASTLKKAMQKGIKVLTWDADSDKDSRHFFVNQATYEGIGSTLVDIMADEIGGTGDVAIITGSLTAANQDIWMDFMRKRIASSYPKLNVLTVKPSEEDQQLAFQVAQDLIKAYPSLKGIWGITSVAFPGVARAVRESGYAGKIAVTGLSTPNSMREYVKDGTVKTVLLWNPVDLGYLTVYAARKFLDEGSLPQEFIAGRLGKVQVRGKKEILLGPPMRFTKNNIDAFNS